jgi:hypothetical protein
MRWTTGSWMVLAAALGLAACNDVDVDGTIDGQEVGGARSAIFGDIDFDIPFIGSIEYTAILLSDVPDACDVFTKMVDAEDAADDCEELCTSYLQIADEHDIEPEEYWSLQLTVNTNDGAVGSFDFSEIAGETDEFSAFFTRVDGTQIADQAACEAACEDGELLESEEEIPDDGTLELAEVDGDELPGEFTLEFGGTDLLEGSFDADPCDLESLFQ